MTIDVSQLTKRKVTKQEVHLSLHGTDLFKYDKEIRINEPVSIDGSLALVGDIIQLDVVVHAKLLLQCSRCIENFVHEIDLDVHEKFSSNQDNNDDSIIFIDSDAIDITEIIENNIILALPIKKLCNDDCKGLCQKCGTNLNINTCSCDNKDVDPRLAKLKDLF